MSDVEDDEDESSLHFTDEEVKKDSTVKRGLQNPIIKANSNPLSFKEPEAEGNDDEGMILIYKWKELSLDFCFSLLSSIT